MSTPLDPIGNISLVLQVAILFILILGLPLATGGTGKKNLIRHGYLTVFALTLHAILIFVVMIPVFTRGISDIPVLPILIQINIISHITLGTAAEVLGVIIVAIWFAQPKSSMAGYKAKKLMWPLFIIWAISVINGAIIHIFGML